MGGNLWFFGKDEDSALDAAEAAAEAVKPIPGVVMTFPGGIAASGSKAGSDYSFLDCKHLREILSRFFVIRSKPAFRKVWKASWK